MPLASRRAAKTLRSRPRRQFSDLPRAHACRLGPLLAPGDGLVNNAVFD